MVNMTAFALSVSRLLKMEYGTVPDERDNWYELMYVK